MTMVRLAPLVLATALAACASMSPAPAGMEAGSFVKFDCEGQDFQARWNPDSASVRVRTQHGAAELTRVSDNVFQGEGYELKTGDGIVLSQGGKVLGKACKRA